MKKPKLTLILGAGFSGVAGISTTLEIPQKFFLSEPERSNLPPDVEKKITEILRKYWKDVFGYNGGDATPTLEDHFTLLDLAANSGHHLGKDYSPRELRAIRRMSIHRVFQLVSKNKRKMSLSRMLHKLNENFKLSVVTLNWDLVLERHLHDRNKKKNLDFHYPIETFKFPEVGKDVWKQEGIPIMKMHGSIGWVYCDSCRRIYSGKVVGQAVKRNAYLEAKDFEPFSFEPFSSDADLRKTIEESIKNDRKCPNCENIMAGRVATFSYRKAFSIAQFHQIWERAHSYLSRANVWLIIGYSLPQADFEFLHLLKSAQLARKKPKIEVIINDKQETINRYESTFGLINDKQIKKGGLENWIKKEMGKFIEENS